MHHGKKGVEMRTFHQKRAAEKDRSLLRLALLALALTVAVELFNHKAFSDGPAAFWVFLAKRPLAAAVDYLLESWHRPPPRKRMCWRTLRSTPRGRDCGRGECRGMGTGVIR